MKHKMIVYYSDVAYNGSNPEDVIDNANIMLSFWKNHKAKGGIQKRFKRIYKSRKKGNKREIKS